MGCAPANCLAAGDLSGKARQAAGETVLLLHGSAGGGALWRQTVAELQPLYRCLAPDLIGYGAATPWPQGEPFTLDAERLALEPLLACCAGAFHLVGYSYGGVVALQLALANPARVRTLTLIEPVYFNVLRDAARAPAFVRFQRLRQEFMRALAQGDAAAAMRPFIDFWAGEGAWQRLPDPLRADMLRWAGKIALEWEAVFAFAPPPQGLAALGNRTLLVRGDRSPAAMLELVDALHGLMPGSARVVLAGANHLLPSTHASELTRAILSHLHVDAERRLR
jgi:pimeloyl-ACP methyl ester carboxylesterase